MEAWERWWRMAQDSYTSAQLLQQHGQFRASASRGYYAAYQAATALLLYIGRVPPVGREAWSHDLTPDLLREMPNKLLKAVVCNDIATRLKACYELRIIADYISAANVEEDKLKQSLKGSRFIIYKVIGSILPLEEV